MTFSISPWENRLACAVHVMPSIRVYLDSLEVVHSDSARFAFNQISDISMQMSLDIAMFNQCKIQVV
jgi:hypothetical protein